MAGWLAVAAWMGVIFALSSISGLRVSEDAEVDRPMRTLAHMASFGLLSGLLLHALCANGRPTLSRAALALTVTVLYAASDELHQSLVPDRMGRPQDVAIDTLGAIVGLAVAWFILARRSGPAVDGAPGRRSG